MNNKSIKTISIPQNILQTLLNVICENTGLSIVLVDLSSEPKPIDSEKSLKNQIDFCKVINSTEFGEERCYKNHIDRALEIKNEGITVCHAGLLNFAIPIKIETQKIAVLLCGELGAMNTEYEYIARKNFNSFIEEFRKNNSDDSNQQIEKKLRKLYENLPSGSIEDSEKRMLRELSRISKWIYWAYRELNKIDSEKNEIWKKRDKLLKAAKFLVQDMVVQSQRAIDIIYIIYLYAAGNFSSDKSLKYYISEFNNILKSVRDKLSNIHGDFRFDVKIPKKESFVHIIPPIYNHVLNDLLDVFCESTGLAIGLFELTGSERTLVTDISKNNFTKYCKTIWSTECGKKLCDSDHIERANSIDKEKLSLCHAGLHNYGIPIKYKDKNLATLLCGQGIIKDKADIARKNHEEFISKLSSIVTKEEEKKLILQLKELYQKFKPKTNRFPHLAKFRNMANLCAWMYRIHEETIIASKEMKKIIDDYHSISQEEKYLYHDIAPLGIQAILDNLTWIKHEHPAEIEIQKCAIDMLDILDGSKKRLLFSKPAQIAWDEAKKELINLVELIDRGISELTRSAYRKHVFFSFLRPEEKILLYGYYNEIYIALWNILHNAVKYSHSGFHRNEGIEVKIWLETDHLKYIINVQNFGIGILEGEYEYIYKSGNRGKLAEKERPRGTGRGLFIASGMLKNNDCFIHHESKELENERYLTTFLIDIPKVNKGEL